MEDYMKRVIDEEEQLKYKIEKLRNFINTNNYFSLDLIDKSLLEKQLEIMEKYDQILNERIARFGK